MKTSAIAKRISVISTSIAMTLSFVGCSVEQRSAEDVTPKTLGESEGLWLYRSNARMRTNGDDIERLINDIKIGDTVYTSDDYSVDEIDYLTDYRIIFYVITLADESRHVVRYDYKNKVYSYVYDVTEYIGENIRTQYSNEYYYLADDDNKRGVLFSASGEMLCDSVYGGLDGDIVHTAIEQDHANYTFSWYKNGATHSITSDISGVDFNAEDFIYYNNYCYFLDSRYPRAIDASNGTVTGLKIKANDPESRAIIDEIYTYNGHLYLFTLQYENDDHVYRLFDVYEGQARFIYNFGNGAYGSGSKMQVKDNMLYFSLPYDGRHVKYFSYNADTDTIKRVLAKDFNKGMSLSEYEYKNSKAKKKVVGEYSFYVDSIMYDAQPNMFGMSYTKTCTYLMREHKGKSEFMQYDLKGDSHFFDDICDF